MAFGLGESNQFVKSHKRRSAPETDPSPWETLLHLAAGMVVRQGFTAVYGSVTMRTIRMTVFLISLCFKLGSAWRRVSCFGVEDYHRKVAELCGISLTYAPVRHASPAS
jgi:hypothetical protein